MITGNCYEKINLLHNSSNLIAHISTLVWYLFLINAFSGSSDNSIAGVILFAGAVIYAILTLVQIIAGVREVKECLRVR